MAGKYNRPVRTAFSRYEYAEQNLAPKRGTVQTTAGDRVIGRLFNVNLPGTEHNVLKDLAGDIFFALYKYDPRLVQKDKLDTDRLINRTLMEWLLQQPYYELARSSTMLNLPSAVGATRKVWQALLEDEMIQRLFDQMIQQERLLGIDGKDKSEKNQKKSGQSGEGSGGSGQEQSQEKSEEELQKLREQIEKQAEKLQNSGILEALIARAAKEGASEGERVKAILRAWGIDQQSIGENLDMDEIAKLATMNFDSIAYIASIIGRVAQASSKTMEQIKAGFVGPPTKMALTRDLSRISPTERLKLSPTVPPFIRATQVSRYASQGLLGWQPASEGKKTGPFAAYVDSSGSMDGEKINVAKAIAFGMARALMDDKSRQRSFRIRSFSDRGQVTPFVDQDSSATQLFNWAEYHFGSGTDFDTVLEYSLRDLGEMKKEGTDGADMLIITDGDGHLSIETVQRWKRYAQETMGTRFMFIFVGSDYEYDTYRSRPSFIRMKELSHFFMRVSELEFIENPELVATKLVESIYLSQEGKK